ncbi:MAG: ATP-binding protein [Tissierellales bacterium]|nr:ATP-binding protein [Tissierellales bacterium]MBN2827196.1 ATP-binding protein [Tissierellales bacterium]
MKETIKLEIPKKSEFISIIRLTTSFVANNVGFNIEEIDDLKVVVSEMCIYFINHLDAAIRPLNIVFQFDNHELTVEIEDLNFGLMAQEKEDMGIMIIQSLADQFSLDIEKKKILISKRIQ